MKSSVHYLACFGNTQGGNVVNLFIVTLSY